MATIVNNQPPATTESRSNGAGMIIGIVLLIVLLLLMFNFAVPALRGGANTVQPTGGTQEVQETNESTFSVPEEVDVNVNTPNGEAMPE
jgi:hypothetical protein